MRQSASLGFKLFKTLWTQTRKSLNAQYVMVLLKCQLSRAAFILPVLSACLRGCGPHLSSMTLREGSNLEESDCSVLARQLGELGGACLNSKT